MENITDKSKVTIVDDSSALKFNLLEDKDIEEAQFIFSAIREYVNRNLQEKVDYGLIPGCGNKPVLFKPGAEKLCRLFKLRPTFEIVDKIIDYQANLFHYHYRCNLYRFGELVGMCDGIASSKESKFSKPLLTCPHCNHTESIRKDKNSDSYYCWTKLGGCGAKGLKPEDVGGGETFNYNTINTLCKMAQKRSLVGAVLLVCGASEYFTQDLED